MGERRSSKEKKKPKLLAGARVWLVCEGASLGAGRAALLEAIERYGSITQAARSLGVSYRAAWQWIDRMNERAGGPLVETISGGTGGGGTRLTPLARSLIKAYQLADRGVQKTLRDVNRQIADLISKSSERRPAGSTN